MLYTNEYVYRIYIYNYHIVKILSSILNITSVLLSIWWWAIWQQSMP